MKCHFEKKIRLFIVLFCFICLCGCGSKHEDTTPVGGWIEGEDTPSSSDQITDAASASESGEGESSTQAEKGESEGQVFLCFELINYEWLRLALEPLDMSGTDNPLEAGKDAPVYTYNADVGEKLEAYGEIYENISLKDVFYYEVGSGVRSYTVTLYNPDGTIDSTYDMPVAPYKDAFIVINAELEDGTEETYGFWYYIRTGG